MKWETFCDLSYYDMWAVRPVGMRDFNRTLHFAKREEAEFAVNVLDDLTEKKAPVAFPLTAEEVRWVGYALLQYAADYPVAPGTHITKRLMPFLESALRAAESPPAISGDPCRDATPEAAQSPGESPVTQGVTA